MSPAEEVVLVEALLANKDFFESMRGSLDEAPSAESIERAYRAFQATTREILGRSLELGEAFAMTNRLMQAMERRLFPEDSVAN